MENQHLAIEDQQKIEDIRGKFHKINRKSRTSGVNSTCRQGLQDILGRNHDWHRPSRSELGQLAGLVRHENHDFQGKNRHFQGKKHDFSLKNHRQNQ